MVQSDAKSILLIMFDGIEAEMSMLVAKIQSVVMK